MTNVTQFPNRETRPEIDPIDNHLSIIEGRINDLLPAARPEELPMILFQAMVELKTEAALFVKDNLGDYFQMLSYHSSIIQTLPLMSGRLRVATSFKRHHGQLFLTSQVTTTQGEQQLVVKSTVKPTLTSWEGISTDKGWTLIDSKLGEETKKYDIPPKVLTKFLNGIYDLDPWMVNEGWKVKSSTDLVSLETPLQYDTGQTEMVGSLTIDVPTSKFILNFTDKEEKENE